jgi:hypothetical protein
VETVGNIACFTAWRGSLVIGRLWLSYKPALNAGFGPNLPASAWVPCAGNKAEIELRGAPANLFDVSQTNVSVVRQLLMSWFSRVSNPPLSTSRSGAFFWRTSHTPSNRTGSENAPPSWVSVQHLLRLAAGRDGTGIRDVLLRPGTNPQPRTQIPSAFVFTRHPISGFFGLWEMSFR